MKPAGKLLVISWVVITAVSLVSYALFRLGGPLPPEGEFRRSLEKELSRMGLQHFGRREVLKYSNGRLCTKIAIAFDFYDNPVRLHGSFRVRKVTNQAMQAIIKVLTDHGCDPRSREVDILVKARLWTPPSPTGRRQPRVAETAHYDYRNDQVTFSHGDFHASERWEPTWD